MDLLSAREFIEQGTTAGAVMSIAASQSDPRKKKKIEAVASEVARITGQSIQIPGALTISRERRNRSAANDNRPQRRRVA